MHKYLEKKNEVHFDKIFNQVFGKLRSSLRRMFSRKVNHFKNKSLLVFNFREFWGLDGNWYTSSENRCK